MGRGSEPSYAQPPLEAYLRQLPPKRAKLQARKSRLSRKAWCAGLGEDASGLKGRLLCSTDGTLAFALRSASVGLIVERRHCPSNGPRTAQTIIFDSAAGFDRWCAAEPVRFFDPILFNELCREGHEVLGTRR
jgi:hypothetical protein